MDFTYEIERLRSQIREKELDFSGSKSVMIDLNLDTLLVIPPHDYYYSVLKQLHFLLLNDNLQLNLTHYDIFRRFWKLAKKCGEKNKMNYNCWLTQLSDEEKNRLLERVVVPNDFEDSGDDFGSNFTQKYGCGPKCTVL